MSVKRNQKQQIESNSIAQIDFQRDSKHVKLEMV